MSEFREMREKDLMNPGVLYRAYKDYMYLLNFLQNNREQRVVSDDEIRDRLKYLLHNKVRQRDEISTLCWILGEEDVREKDKY